jgi:hypothetical protein
MNSPVETRSFLLERIERDLVGPLDLANPVEVLRDNPADKYLTGILFPRQLAIPEEEDDELPPSDDEENSGNETAVPLSQCVRPASAGLSFTIRRRSSEEPPEIFVKVVAARYVKRWVSESDPNELTDKERRGRDYVRWERVPPPDVTVPSILNFNERNEPLGPFGLAGLYLHVRVAGNDRGVGVTVVLINEHKDARDRDENERNSWFQTELIIKPGDGCEFVGRPLRREAMTPDDQTAALIYRDFLEFAVGHTCSASWNASGDAIVDEVRTAWLPRRSVEATSADGDVVFEPVRKHATLKPFSASWLAGANKDDLLNALASVPDAYAKWITSQSGLIGTLPDSTLQAYAAEHRKLWIKARDRMRSAIEWLGKDSNARNAFKLGNNAMQIQRQWSRKQDLSWRPFQIAFQLLVLESALNPKHGDRSVMDLLWFPTGGGKTEAYLGVIAMVLFYRRLSRTSPDEGAGVSIIMRYTLRVLTTQQFDRAAFLICACERLRLERNLPAGPQPFSIGLWVGGTATPNRIADAHADPKRAMQIKKCPCCGNRLSVDDIQTRFAIKCLSQDCFFGQRGDPLPIWTVDQDIYRELPSLLIGTIDKFAQVARNRATGGLFGIETPTPHAPPDLIIQDELHLISGPLGTIAGLYEIAVDAFCSSHGSVPKIIGSTATIKMAGQQVRALFNRDVFQFPPPGLDASNSCFAVRDDTKTGRLYLGITTAGRSAKFTLQAACASLLQAAFSPQIPEPLKDFYWTLVAYFNALRELGGAHVLMLDDVPKSIGEYAGRRSESPRTIIEPAELTSRLSQTEIPEVLEKLTQGRSTGRAEDTLLSTNMISVGVDIPRLALMLVNGQPKAISEYIQATSRVGRDIAPGLVVTVFNSGKPRDRSHYETFATWHSTLYRDVEATSVTPFAARAVDKALRAVLVAMVRHLVPDMRQTPVLTNARRPAAEAMRDLIVQRAAIVDPEERNAVETRLDIILDEWQARMGLEQYWVEDKPKKTLLMSAERVASLKAANRSQGYAWPAPNSMREVEPGTHFRLI